MKIMICGSMAFICDIAETKEKLETLGHKAYIPLGSEPYIADSSFADNLDANMLFCIDNNLMKRNFDQIADSDAILVLNLKRKGIDGYVGISALMEMGVAHFLKKKIFLLNDIPDHKQHRWAQEVRIIKPLILNGDLSKIR